jgi:hypothetical protein
MASLRRAGPQASQRLILDSGAVIALSRGDQRARAFLARAQELGTPVEIPVVVFGRDDARRTARRAGQPCAESGRFGACGP